MEYNNFKSFEDYLVNNYDFHEFFKYLTNDWDNNKSILEVQCGLGHYARILNSLNFSTVSFDNDINNIKFCYSNFVNCNFKHYTGNFLPTIENEFDYCILNFMNTCFNSTLLLECIKSSKKDVVLLFYNKFSFYYSFYKTVIPKRIVLSSFIKILSEIHNLHLGTNVSLKSFIYLNNSQFFNKFFNNHVFSLPFGFIFALKLRFISNKCLTPLYLTKIEQSYN